MNSITDSKNAHETLFFLSFFFFFFFTLIALKTSILGFFFIAKSVLFQHQKIIDIIEYTLKQKWKWAGHIARLRDNRWTKRCTEWQPRRGKRSRGRPSRR